MSSEEWTFVTKSTRRRYRSGAAKARPGLHQPSIKKDNRGNRDQYHTIVSKSKGRVVVIQALLECMESLERQYRAGEGFVIRLLNALANATNHNVSTDDRNESKCKLPNLEEIVVYGVGNFSCEIYSASMLQLAVALLLRRLAVEAATNGSSRDYDNHQELNIDGSTNATSFSFDQQRIPIFYYEPCTLPLEKVLLQEVFYVHVLESNDMGKLSVSSMNEQLQSQTSQPQNIRKQNSQYNTLFYMPHCPMRLYCNIIWAHWDHIMAPQQAQLDSIPTNPVVVFGNSFHAYDERTISSEQKSDPTNGIFRLIQCVNEQSIYSASENKNLEDSLIMLERAFNDCNVISFSIPQDTNIEKPQEYFLSDDIYENGELL